MRDMMILVGTETGNAEQIARALVEVFAYVELEPEIVDMFDASPELVRQSTHVLICTSTHGDGDLPANAERFVDALHAQTPDLSGVQFAVCALGDHLYDPYFCEAGKTFEQLLVTLGATPVIERFEIDGEPTDDDVEQAQAWALDVVDACRHVLLA